MLYLLFGVSIPFRRPHIAVSNLTMSCIINGMNTPRSSPGFEYRNKKDETPFETFLRYTDEKEKSATQLADILQGKLVEGSKILDIGTGNGEYLGLALSKLKNLRDVQLTLVEPSDDLVKQLKARFKELVPASNLKVIKSKLEDLASNELFDVILMSHLFYHIPLAARAEQLMKALSLLKPGGALIIAMRDRDDIYTFKMKFMPKLFDDSFRARTIDDILGLLPKDMPSLRITKHVVAAELRIPVEQNKDDARSVIEFCLHKPWGEMPKAIQQEATMFVKNRKGVLKQLDCIAVIERL